MLIMPLISYVAPGDTSYMQWHIGKVEFGTFLGEVINFLIIALAVFILLVKIVGGIVKGPCAEGPPMKECPLCCSNIPSKARKCAHCTADLRRAVKRNSFRLVSSGIYSARAAKTTAPASPSLPSTSLSTSSET